MEFSVYEADLKGIFVREVHLRSGDNVRYKCLPQSFWNSGRQRLCMPDGTVLLEWERSLTLWVAKYILYRDGEEIGTVQKQPLSNRYEVVVEGETIEVRGNLWQKEFTFVYDGVEVAKVSRKILRNEGAFGIAIMEGQDDLLYLAILTIIIDVIRRQNSS